MVIGKFGRIGDREIAVKRAKAVGDRVDLTRYMVKKQTGAKKQTRAAKPRVQVRPRQLG